MRKPNPLSSMCADGPTSISLRRRSRSTIMISTYAARRPSCRGCMTGCATSTSPTRASMPIDEFVRGTVVYEEGFVCRHCEAYLRQGVNRHPKFERRLTHKHRRHSRSALPPQDHRQCSAHQPDHALVGIYSNQVETTNARRLPRHRHARLGTPCSGVRVPNEFLHLCVPKIRFGNIGGEVHRGPAVK
jgi:hypothetical protein